MNPTLKEILQAWIDDKIVVHRQLIEYGNYCAKWGSWETLKPGSPIYNDDENEYEIRDHNEYAIRCPFKVDGKLIYISNSLSFTEYLDKRAIFETKEEANSFIKKDFPTMTYIVETI